MSLSVKKIGNDTEIDRILNENFISSVRPTGFVEIGEDKFVLPALYNNWKETLNKFEIRNDDVFILGHPKTGTTWLQELVWLIANDLDYETREKQIITPVKYFEFPTYLDRVETATHFDDMVKLTSPRVIKSHLHWALLPEQIKNGTKKPKIISILRNPHDTFISYYHHCRLMEGYKGTLEDLSKLFLGGRNILGPYFKSILSVWEERHRPNLLFIKFAEMKADFPGVVKKIANFLEKQITDEEVTKLAQYLSFESMKNNPAFNMHGVVEYFSKRFGLYVAGEEFMRSGKVGGYKAEMTPEMIEQFDQWQAENLKGCDLKFE